MIYMIKLRNMMIGLSILKLKELNEKSFKENCKNYQTKSNMNGIKHAIR